MLFLYKDVPRVTKLQKRILSRSVSMSHVLFKPILVWLIALNYALSVPAVTCLSIRMSVVLASVFFMDSMKMRACCLTAYVKIL